MWENNELKEKIIEEVMEGLGFTIKDVQEMNIDELSSVENSGKK